MAAMNWLAAQLAWERRLTELRGPVLSAARIPADRHEPAEEQPQAA